MTDDQIDTLAFYLVLAGAIVGGVTLAFIIWYLGVL